MRKLILTLLIIILFINIPNVSANYILYKNNDKQNIPNNCTTIIVMGNASFDGGIIVAKNRDLNELELQWLYYMPRKTHPPESMVKLQYIEIPQVSVTWAWIGSKSYTKKWGVGMGINEWGLVIVDNDAPTREPLEGYNGLHDNDINRLVLERCKTAYEAVLFIGELIEKYGHSFTGEIYTISDPNEAWVVEAAAHHWAAVRIRDGIKVIANQFQITNKWDLASADLVEYAIGMGWCESLGEFSFARCYSPSGYPYKNSTIRIERVMNLLKLKFGNITVDDVEKVLSDHYEGTYMYEYPPHENKNYRTICTKRTVASMIAHLRNWVPRQLQLIWYAMTSPCTSVYLPIYASATKIPTPYQYGVGGDWSNYDPNSAWWIFKRLQTIVDNDYNTLHPMVRDKLDKLYSQVKSKKHVLEEDVARLLDLGQEDEAINQINSFTSEELFNAYTVAKELISQLTEGGTANFFRWSYTLDILMILSVIVVIILYFKFRFIKH